MAYEFTENRLGGYPQSWLRDWEGYLVADTYTDYDRLFATPPIKGVDCSPHARRKFFEVARLAQGKGLAREAASRIGAFSHLDNQWWELPHEERQRRRREEIGPLLDEFRRWIEVDYPKLLPQGPLVKTMGYVLKQWVALTRFVDDGRLPLDNNVAKRALRPIALGRKNWLFAGSVRGGEAAALIL